MRCCGGDEGCGPSASPFGGASNRLMLGWLMTVVVSDEEKAPVEVSGGDQEGERERTAVEVSKSLRWHRNRGQDRASGMGLAGARVLAGWCPACRRREPGLRLLHGTWEGRCRYRPPVAPGGVPGG